MLRIFDGLMVEGTQTQVEHFTAGLKKLAAVLGLDLDGEEDYVDSTDAQFPWDEDGDEGEGESLAIPILEVQGEEVG